MFVTVPTRELGSASTWSLDRLDALAAEASALFEHRARLGMPPRELPSQAMNLQPKPSRKGSLSSALGTGQPLGTAGAMVRRRGAEGQKERAVGEAVSSPRSSRKGRTSRRRGPARQSSSGSSVGQAAAQQAQPPLMPKPAKQQRASDSDERDQRTLPTAGSKKSSGTSKGSSASLQAMGLTAESPVIRDGSAASCVPGDASVCQFPMHALTAINDVLFGRHGYRRMALHGDPRQVPPGSVESLCAGFAAIMHLLSSLLVFSYTIIS